MSDDQQSSRLLTLVFTDVVDSTALKAQHGDFRAGELLERDRVHVERIAREHGGRVIDWAGDGCFLTFETSSEAVLFAVDLQRAHIEDPEMPAIRIGIHMGEVTERKRADGTVRVEGLTVDLTARLESLAHPNQILMSEAVYHSARQRLRHREPEITLVWKSHGAFHLKGFDDPIEACVVGFGDGSPLAPPERSEKAWPVDVATISAAPGSKPTSENDLRLLRRLFRRPQGVAAILALAIAVGFAIFYVPSIQRNQTEARVKWAREEAVPEVQALVLAGNYGEALSLAREADEFIDDMLLNQLIEQSSSDLDILTNVPGASVSYKPYDQPEADWIPAGTTPIDGLQIPVGMYRWRVELDGYAAREFARAAFPGTVQGIGEINVARYDLTLVKEAPELEGMTYVEGGVFFPGITGIGMVEYSIGDFLIDTTEVTNAAYREFVEAGGYENPEYWQETFADIEDSLTFEQAIGRFVDATGRPGPATWVMGDIPEGKENYPVQGVSWFEAMAYAKYRRVTLPTVYHWARAALPEMEAGDLVLTPLMIGYSNLESDGPIPVATNPDMSASGAYNMAGNVREWCLNARDELRFAMGGQWDESQYVLFNAMPVDPWDRTPGNGFRCMRLAEDGTIAPELMEPIGEYTFRVDRERYTEANLRVMMNMSSSVRPLENYGVEVESVDTDERNRDRTIVTIASPILNERIPLILDMPKDGEGPWPVVIFVPGMDSLYLTDPDLGLSEHARFIPQSERMLVRPVLHGMYYRNDGTSRRQFVDSDRRGLLLQTWIKELNQTIAYLKTRPDVEAGALSYYGISLGAIIGVSLGASNSDVHAIVLGLGGLPAVPADELDSPAPVIEEIASLVQQPTLMLNGRFDFLFPLKESQIPLMESISTSDDHKRHVLFDEGHSMPPLADTIAEILPWLDRYEHGIPNTAETGGGGE